jgi:MEMO1 family protein
MAQPETIKVRPPKMAGSWYPRDPAVLRRTIDQLLGDVQPLELPGRVMAVVSPHAGYRYSGPVAAHAYAQLRGTDISRVVMFGPLHRMPWGSLLSPHMVPYEDAYATPLGQTLIDRAFLDELGRRVKLTALRREDEHSLENQLPFLQAVLPSFTIAPILFAELLSDRGAMGRADALAAALAGMVDEHTVIAVSTDLCHLHNYADVVRIDGRLAQYVDEFDVDGLAHALQTEEVQACGAVGLAVALKTAQRLGAKGARVLRYTASGDVTGDRRPGDFNVGYLAAAVYAK